MIDDSFSGKLLHTAQLLHAKSIIVAESNDGDPCVGIVFTDKDGPFADHRMSSEEALEMADRIRKIAERQLARGRN